MRAIPVDEAAARRVVPPRPPATAVDIEEAEWLARAGAGDRDGSFTDLYRRYESRVYGLGIRLLGDRGLAEELVQETFLRLWRGAGGYRPERGSVRAYVFTIARRVAVTLWRRPSSRPMGGEGPEGPEPGADDRVEEIILAVAVRDAMDALTPEHRQILALCVERDLSQAQAAAELGIPIGTVKSRTHHALRSLHDALAERGVLA